MSRTLRAACALHSTAVPRGEAFEMLYLDCKESSKESSKANAKVVALLEKDVAHLVALREKDVARLEKDVALLQKDVALLHGLLISRRILEEIAKHKHPAEKSTTQAIRLAASDKSFVLYLDVVGKATGYKAKQLAELVVDSYKDLSSCIHKTVPCTLSVKVVPAAVFNSTAVAIAVHAFFLFYGPLVGGGNLMFTNLDSTILAIPAPITPSPPGPAT